MPAELQRHLLIAAALMSGCSGAPERFVAPSVNAEEAARQAIQLYDADADGSLSEAELKACPGILGKLAAYDQNRNGAVEETEIATHLGKLLNSTGGTQLSAFVSYKGKALGGASVVMEPEPYLGDAIQAAAGVTDPAGLTVMEIPAEFLPEHLRRLKMVHYGTFKVRITHPTTKLPEKFNTQTELGYETEPGKPSVTFDLK